MKLSIFAAIAIEVVNLQLIKNNLYRTLRWGNIYNIETLSNISLRCAEIDKQIKIYFSVMQIDKKVIS